MGGAAQGLGYALAETGAGWWGLMIVNRCSSLLGAAALTSLLACGGAPAAPRPTTPSPTAPVAAAPTADPDLASTPARPLIAVDWATVPLATEADARALWAVIAPTGDDWEGKLAEIPVAAGRPLALAHLRGGNLTCAPARPVTDCGPPRLDIEDPAPGATLADPCLRRLVALWAIAQLEDADLPATWDALRAVVQLPPPESELISAAITAVPEDDGARRLELIALAHQAGHRELASSFVGKLDEAHVVLALGRHHIEGALDVLAAGSHRPAFLAAVTDEALAPTARARAIAELVAAADEQAAIVRDDLVPARATPALPADLRAALVTATRAPDCLVAAAAARALEIRGDAAFVPRPPKVRTTASMMRALCVLASYERLQGNDEPSRLPAFVPTRGLEIATITYDALGDVDTDGDGDPHTERALVLAPREDLALPEIEDLIRALRQCTGTTCTSPDREFRFTFKPVRGALALTRLEVAERPACPRP